jgi:hypothetical protein
MTRTAASSIFRHPLLDPNYGFFNTTHNNLSPN